MFNCRQATRLLSVQQERRLTTTEKLQLNIHTLWCSACRNFGVQMNIIRRLSRHHAKTMDVDQDNSAS